MISLRAVKRIGKVCQCDRFLGLILIGTDLTELRKELEICVFLEAGVLVAQAVLKLAM